MNRIVSFIINSSLKKYTICFIFIIKIHYFQYKTAIDSCYRFVLCCSFMVLISYFTQASNAMDDVALLITIAVTATNTVLCADVSSKDSVVFSVASRGRLAGELLLDTLKDALGECLYACMQQTSCLTVSYHRSSRRCKLMTDVLFKEDIIDDIGWESYGHFESLLVNYIQNCVLF